MKHWYPLLFSVLLICIALELALLTPPPNTSSPGRESMQPDIMPDKIREGVWECMVLDGKEWKLQDPAQCPPITK